MRNRQSKWLCVWWGWWFASVLGSTQAAPLSFDQSFGLGWNLAGNSADVALDVDTFTSVPAAGKVVSVWMWNAAQGRWAFYAPTLAASGSLAAYAAQKGYDVLRSIPPGAGYWINASAEFSVLRDFNPVPGNVLVQGWNLAAVGEARAADTFAAAMKTAVGSEPVSLWAWDGPQGKWYFHAPTLAVAGTLAGYVAQKGYLEFSARMLAPGTGFWVNASAGGFVSGLGASAATEVLLGTVSPAVSGLHYRTATQSGYVDVAGRYRFVRGEQVEFSIGGVMVSAVPAQSDIVFLPTDDPLVATNILRLVKALDSDGSLANGIEIPPMPGANPQGVRLDDETTLSAVLSQLKPAATLPAASDGEVAAVLATVQRTQQRQLSGYGSRYDSFSVMNMGAYCQGQRLPLSATVRLLAQPDWDAGLFASETTLVFGDGSRLVLPTSTLSGAATIEGTSLRHAFSKGSPLAGTRVIRLKVYVGGNTLCHLADISLRDASQANRPPLVRSDMAWDYAPDILGVGWSIWRTEGHIRRFQPLGFIDPKTAAWDSDGHVVKLEWTTSKGTTGFATASPTNPNLYGIMLLQLQIARDEAIDIDIVATDDEGATSKRHLTLGRVGSVDARLKELDGKLFVRRVVSADSSGEIHADSQYYLYDSMSGMVYQIMCIDRLRAGTGTLPSWAATVGLTGAKQCMELSMPASDPGVAEVLNAITPLGADKLIWRDPTNPALSMTFERTDAIPAGYDVHGDNGTLLRTTDGKGAGLVKPTPVLGSEAGSWAGSGSTGDQAAIGQACLAAYAGPTGDPQFDTFCRLAQFDGCVDKATGTTTYKREAEAVCRTLNGLIEATSGDRYVCQYCPYPGP